MNIASTITQIITLLIALTTAFVAWRTFVIQQSMDRRDLAYRKNRARLAVNTLYRGLRLIITTYNGAGPGDVAKRNGSRWDVLTDVRDNFSELAWIPDCEWKQVFSEMIHTVLPKPSLGSAAKIDKNMETLGLVVGRLQPSNSLYKECMNIIDRMT